MLTGAYLPRDSPVHRAPAALKLALLGAGLLLLAVLPAPAAVPAAAVVILALTALARVGARALAAQVRPVLWVLVPVAAVQLWLAGPARAFGVAGAILVAVAAAGLVTLTTRTEALLDARNARHVAGLLADLPQQVVLVTHHLEQLEGFDRVLVVDAGRVVADGAPGTALAAYSALVG